MTELPEVTTLERALAGWLPRQRWYAGKGRPVAGVRVAHPHPLTSVATAGGEPVDVLWALVVVAHPDGEERYQVPLGVTAQPRSDLEPAAIVGDERGVVYDALADRAVAAGLLGLLAAGRPVGPIAFELAPGVTLDTAVTSRPLGAEQSHTSLVFGSAYILKTFRRLVPGISPDLELTRVLAGAGSPHVAEPLAWAQTAVDGVPTTLCLLQRLVPGASEGWALATESVRDLLDEGDLLAEEVGGDFAAESERLGRAVAEVHRDLARLLPVRDDPPQALAAIAAAMADQARAAAEIQPDLVAHLDAILAVFDDLRTSGSLPVQRIHGDLHLGQVIRAPSGWVLLDFEGEPARPLAERVALQSPLKDVAGMLRSFDYAARHLLVGEAGAGQPEFRAREWAQRNREAFCDGYAAVGEDPRTRAALLRAFELDKAVYEVAYETRHRPAWVPIPLGSIHRLVKG